MIGSDVWADGAEDAARRAAETLGLPVITNGMGRGILPAGHPFSSPGPDPSLSAEPTW